MNITEKNFHIHKHNNLLSILKCLQCSPKQIEYTITSHTYFLNRDHLRQM